MEIQFTVPWSHKEEVDAAFPLPEDYEYWRPIISQFLVKADIIEIHCWNEEQEVILEIQSVFKRSVHDGDNMTIFKSHNG